MLLKDVLEFHHSYPADQGHSEILGDGYLMRSNPVYRNVKLLAKKMGCEYVEAYPRYLLLPFHELQTIVQSKKVPYVPSAKLMEEVEKTRPQTFAIDDVPMPESYHLHEAAHVIADQIVGSVKTMSAQERILKAILCESFANTVDALACASATDDMHLYFISQNSYMKPQKKIMQAMSRLLKDAGPRFVFILTYMTYVHSNFLAEPLPTKTIKELFAKYAPGSKPSANLIKDAQAVCTLGEKLDPQFRVVTTGNYLKLEGFDGEVYDLLDFNFQTLLVNNSGFMKAIDSLAEAIQY